MAKVFISYSRKDIEFAKRLTAELQKCELDFWIDWEGIPPTVDWWKEIEKGIEEADAFIFLISPDSSSSKVCGRELDHAIKNGKRLIPLVIRDTNDVPPQLHHLNWIMFRKQDDFPTSFQKLIDGIQTDYEWVHEHTRLLGRAREWDTAGRNSNLLLRGPDLDNAQSWLARASAVKEPKPLPIHGEYIQASRRDSIRRMRITQGVGAAFLIIMVIATIVSFVGFSNASRERDRAREAEEKAVVSANTAVAAEAVARENLAQSERLRFSLEAKQILDSPLGNAEAALLLSLQALKSKYVPEADEVLHLALTRIYTAQIYRGHEEGVESVAISPDGKYILTTSDDQTARLWDASTGQEVRRFEHPDKVKSGLFSPDGSYVLTGGSDSLAHLWETETGREILQLTGHEKKVNSVAFSPDGKTILTGSNDQTARLWDTSTGREMLQFNGHEDNVNSVAFSPDGKTVLTGSDDETARLWDVSTGQEIRQFSGHPRGVLSVAFSPDGTYVVTGSDQNARLFDEATGDLILLLQGHADRVWSVAFSPNGKNILTGSSDQSARIWDIASGQEVRKLSGHTGSIRSVAYAPDGRFALTGSDDRTARLWEAALDQGPRQFIGHSNTISSVAFSPDGKYVLTGSTDSTARLWDAASYQEILQFLGHINSVSSVIFSPDGMRVLTGSKDGTARLWDTATGKEIRSFGDGKKGIESVAFSPDGEYILSSSTDDSAWLFEADTGKEVREFVGHQDTVNSAAFSPDGNQIVTGSDDKTAILWDVATGEAIRQFVGHNDQVKSVAFAPDGKAILTGSDDKTAILWDVATGEKVREFLGHGDQVKSVTFSADGRYVLTGSDDSTARLWDAATGEVLRQFTGHAASVKSVAFSPDGKHILTGSVDQTAKLWDVDYLGTVQFACAHLVRDLTEEERSIYSVSESRPVCDPALATAIVAPVIGSRPTTDETPETPTTSLKNLYTEEFDGSMDAWSTSMTSGIARQVKSSLDGGRFNVKLVISENKLPWANWINDTSTYDSVQVEAVVTNNGNNSNGVSLICHYSDAGWYEFMVSNAGIYTIYAYDPTRLQEERYQELIAGGSPAIQSGLATNTYTAVCNGTELSLFINGTLVNTYTDSRYNYTEGKIGFGASSPNRIPIDVIFESLAVSIPE